MVTTLLRPRRTEPATGLMSRTVSVTARNLVAVQHREYWLVVISGFVEPVLYLLSVGYGVGTLITRSALPDGRAGSYAAFVAPAMLAASAMNGALAESSYNFFARLRWQKVHEAMVSTPLRPFEIVLGELTWATIRGVLCSAVFLSLMILLGLTSAQRASAALFASMLIGFAFGAAGMAVATMLRTWRDFDYPHAVFGVLFLLSGTFTPTAGLPPVIRAVIELAPYYHAIELLRELTTGTPDPTTLVRIAYLLLLAVVGLLVAGRRLSRILTR